MTGKFLKSCYNISNNTEEVKQVEIHNITDKTFNAYGRIHTGYKLDRVFEKMQETPLPEKEVIYVPSDKEIELLEEAETFKEQLFGGLGIQIGYCNGYNKKLNALEYHRSSEIDIAVTDLVLLVGRQQDIQEDFTYNTSLIEAFFVPAGTVAELYATTLHYAPCSAGDNCFRCVIILPSGTNEEIPLQDNASGEIKLLTARNKWLIAHKEAEIKGAFNGLYGENICL